MVNDTPDNKIEFLYNYRSDVANILKYLEKIFINLQFELKEINTKQNIIHSKEDFKNILFESKICEFFEIIFYFFHKKNFNEEEKKLQKILKKKIKTEQKKFWKIIEKLNTNTHKEPNWKLIFLMLWGFKKYYLKNDEKNDEKIFFKPENVPFDSEIFFPDNGNENKNEIVCFGKEIFFKLIEMKKEESLLFENSVCFEQIIVNMFVGSFNNIIPIRSSGKSMSCFFRTWDQKIFIKSISLVKIKNQN